MNTFFDREDLPQYHFEGCPKCGDGFTLQLNWSAPDIFCMGCRTTIREVTGNKEYHDIIGIDFCSCEKPDLDEFKQHCFACDKVSTAHIEEESE